MPDLKCVLPRSSRLTCGYQQLLCSYHGHYDNYGNKLLYHLFAKCLCDNFRNLCSHLRGLLERSTVGILSGALPFDTNSEYISQYVGRFKI